jgi:hypothetical protein
MDSHSPYMRVWNTHTEETSAGAERCSNTVFEELLEKSRVGM